MNFKDESYIEPKLNSPKKMLPPLYKIQETSSNLFRLDEILEECCNEIKENFKFDLVAIQLIRMEEDIIETVKGTGKAKVLSGKARHSLVGPCGLRDIQADIASLIPPSAAIIAGWDKSFDPWIFETYIHKDLVRVFTPLILIWDENGHISEDWWKSENFVWKIHDPVEIEDQNTQKKGRKTILELEIKEHIKNTIDVEIIGTLEAGYQKSNENYKDLFKRISPEQVIQLNKIVAQSSLKIRKVLLPYVLETIINETMKHVKADSASLHFKEISNSHRHYAYEVRAGKINRKFLKKFPPRPGGIGKTAIEENKNIIIPDKNKQHDKYELKRTNPNIYKDGIKAIAAFPLIVDDDNKGVFYVHLQHGNQSDYFTESEIDSIKFYRNQIIEAIRSAINYKRIREKALQLSALQSVGQSLVGDPQRKDLLKQIAWNTLNLLAADIITIYEYDQNESIPIERRFKTPPDDAGRFENVFEMRTELHKDDAPVLLIKRGKELYVPELAVNNTEVLNKKSKMRQNRGRDPFVVREEVKAVAGILLRVGQEIVGVMFVNYRKNHYFSSKEKEIINTLSSFAAIAIKNQRAFLRIQHDLMTVTHQLETPLITLIRCLSHNPEDEAKDSEFREDAQLVKLYREQINMAKNLTEDALCQCHGVLSALAQEKGNKIETTQFEINVKEEIDKLKELFHTVHILPSETTNSPDKCIVCVIAPNFPSIKIDKDIFTNVMYSLIHNAIKYADPQTQVTINCIPSPLSINVKSIGVPIDPKEKEQIFEKFQRGKKHKQTGLHHRGVGLGLWVSRELIRSIDGDLTLELYPDNPKISEFIVSFPSKISE